MLWENKIIRADELNQQIYKMQIDDKENLLKLIVGCHVTQFWSIR